MDIAHVKKKNQTQQKNPTNKQKTPQKTKNSNKKPKPPEHMK